jgi:hypothetical protein
MIGAESRLRAIGSIAQPGAHTRLAMKGFTHARLACGCRIAFREGVEGSPIMVVVDVKSPACPSPLHVRDLPLYDYREALRPATRPLPPTEADYEEEG